MPDLKMIESCVNDALNCYQGIFVEFDLLWLPSQRQGQGAEEVLVNTFGVANILL